MRSVLLVLALIGAGGLRFCSTENTAINAPNTVQDAAPQASPSPGPSASPSAGACSVPRLAVLTVAADNVMAPGETVFVTATPKTLDGQDVPATVHGPNADWSVSGPCALLEHAVAPGAFNRDLQALSTGSCTVRVVACGTPGELTVTVQ